MFMHQSQYNSECWPPLICVIATDRSLPRGCSSGTDALVLYVLDYESLMGEIADNCVCEGHVDFGHLLQRLPGKYD